jgi:hypothetical protein
MTRRRRRHSSGRYDPRPRRGVEPKGLKRWRLGHRRKRHDPGYMSSMKRGRRGGTYFAGPKKRRYDPRPRRYSRARAYFARHPRYGRAGSKIEHGVNRWGMAIGALLGLFAGIWIGVNEPSYNGDFGKYFARVTGGDGGPPEIAHLWTTSGVWNPMSYLSYKFLGIDPNTGKFAGSAWIIPFWTGIGAYIVSKLPIGHKLSRIQRPLGKIGLGVALVSAIGALALPGSPNALGQMNVNSGAQNTGVPYQRGIGQTVNVLA